MAQGGSPPAQGGFGIAQDGTHSPAWWRECFRLLLKQPVLKSLGIPAFMALFFVGYFLLADHPLFAVTVMPDTAVDRLIGFQPWALWLYGSLWVYVSLAPGLIGERRELVAFAIAALGLSLAGMAVFFLWPTATPVSAVDWARYPAYAFLKNADRARNACPSLHVAFSVFSGICIARVLRRIHAPAAVRLLNAAWALAIVYSTLATKQHVALDGVAGALLGGEAALLYLRYLRRRAPAPAAARATAPPAAPMLIQRVRRLRAGRD